MKILLREISLSVSATEIDYEKLIIKKLNIRSSDLIDYTLIRKSLDARKKSDIRYKYTYVIDLEENIAKELLKQGKVEEYIEKNIPYVVLGNHRLSDFVVVVGAGPCGLFATHSLLKLGYPVMLLERGKCIDERKVDVDALHNNGVLNTESNVCFGEGGAGTFSDAKLTTRIKDPRAKSVLQTFVRCGAKPDILYQAKPHVGTDGMQNVIKNLSQEIKDMGGEIRFNTKLTDLVLKQNQVVGIRYYQDGKAYEIQTNAVVLATGHSAKDTFSMLFNCKVFLEKKATAVGFRIEHPREFIDDVQHKNFKKDLGAAEYSLTAKYEGRGIYSFCMCPGGMVVCSSSEKDRLCINGMSNSKRDQENSNSALVVNVKKEDVEDHPLGMLEFIDEIEKKSFIKGFVAPVQRVCDYMDGKVSEKFNGVTPSYPCGTYMKDLNTLMPDYVNQSLKVGLVSFDRKINGFIKNGVLTGVETRTSSPIRIPRNEYFESINVQGLFPAGEGAGYAGGIISSAVDGIKVAEKVAEKFTND